MPQDRQTEDDIRQPNEGLIELRHHTHLKGPEVERQRTNGSRKKDSDREREREEKGGEDKQRNRVKRGGDRLTVREKECNSDSSKKSDGMIERNLLWARRRTTTNCTQGWSIKCGPVNRRCERAHAEGYEEEREKMKRRAGRREKKQKKKNKGQRVHLGMRKLSQKCEYQLRSVGETKNPSQPNPTRFGLGFFLIISLR